MRRAATRAATTLLRSRVAQFAALGALLFAAQHWLAPAPPPPDTSDRRIVASSADAADAEILLREALARGFDRQDKVVRERLVSLARDLGLAAPGDEAALEREARTNGLDRSDPLIRRHLIDMMRLAAAKPSAEDLPDEAALRAYYDAHRDRFAVPARITLVQVFLSRDQRGPERLASDAAALLDDLRRRDLDPDAAALLGDPFVRGARLRRASAATLARTFGRGFATTVFALPEHVWSGPIESPYGLHIVYVAQRAASEPARFESARPRILHALLRERSANRLNSTLAALRRGYDVQIIGQSTAP